MATVERGIGYGDITDKECNDTMDRKGVNLTLILSVLLAIVLTMPTTVVGQIEQPQWLTYQNSKYGIAVQYPSDWKIVEGDRFPGDYETDIVRFYPPDVGDFSEDEFTDKERPTVIVKLSIYSLAPTEDDIDLDTYLDDIINAYLEEDSDIIEWTTDTTLSGQDAYKLVVSGNTPDKGGDYKEMLTGTIVDDKDYYIMYSTKPKEYDDYLQAAEQIIDSYQITNQPN